MTTRREKSKPQKPQINKQLEAANTEEQKPEMENTWIENLGKYLLDISIFVTTGVVIASLFKDMDDSATIYVVGTIVAVSTLIVGLVLTNKTRKGGIELWECILFSSFTAYRAFCSCFFASHRKASAGLE